MFKYEFLDRDCDTILKIAMYKIQFCYSAAFLDISAIYVFEPFSNVVECNQFNTSEKLLVAVIKILEVNM